MPLLFAAFVFGQISQNFKSRFVVLVLAVLVAFNSIYWNWLLLREHTFDQLDRWLTTNVDAQVPIAVVTRRYFSYVPSSEAAAPIQELRGSYYRRLTNLIGEAYPTNVRNVIDISQFGNDSKVVNLKKAMAAYPVIFVIDSYFRSSDRMLAQNEKFNLELVAHFSPSGSIIQKDRIPEPLFDPGYNFPLFVVDRVGPYFDVLRVK